MSESKINNHSKRDLIIQAGMQAIPYVGGSLSTLYFGEKQEKRFQRLELFYEELKKDIEFIKEKIPPLEEQDSSSLESILEILNENVEKEVQDKKIKIYKAFFINTLLNPIKHDFDERKYFLDILANMSVFECEILEFLGKQTQPIQVRSIQKQDTNPYAIFGSINRLRSYGFIESRRGSFMMNGMQDEHLDDLVFVSGFGKKFLNYTKHA